MSFILMFCILNRMQRVDLSVQKKLVLTRANFCNEVGAEKHCQNNSTHDTNFWFFLLGHFVSISSGIPSVCKQVVSVETTRDIEWASYTCTLGFQVFGKWRPPLTLSASSGACLSFNIHLIHISTALSSPQACGPTGQTALTSTLSAGLTIRASWLLEMTLGRSIYSHTPVHSSG